MRRRSEARGERLERARAWLRLVRASGADAGSKGAYLREKGYSEDEVREVLEAEDLEAGATS